MAERLFEIRDYSNRVTTAVFVEQHTLDAQSQFTDFPVGVDDDMVVVGGGGQAEDEPGAFLTASYPSDDRRAWLVSSKDHNIPCPHKLKAFAIGMKVDGWSPDELLTYLHFDMATSSTWPDPAASARAPEGFVLISGGFRVNWSNAGSLATASYPELDETWTARSKDHFAPDPCTIDAYAVSIRSELPVQLEGSEQPTAFVKRGVGSYAGKSGRPIQEAAVRLPSGFAPTGLGAEARFLGPGALLFELNPYESEGPWANAGAREHQAPQTSEVKVWALGIQLARSP